MPVCASTHLRPPLPTAPLPALVAPCAPADEVPLHRAQRGNYRDHPIELAAHDMNHRPRPRPSGAVALSCLRCRCEPLERRPWGFIAPGASMCARKMTLPSRGTFAGWFFYSFLIKYHRVKMRVIFSTTSWGVGRASS